MTGVAPDELVELRSYELPAGTEYLWEWFLRLGSTRTPGFGFASITEQEFRAFFQNRGISPTRWELDLLIRMDRTVRDAEDKSEPDAGDEEE
jgi:hypothetical protein